MHVLPPVDFLHYLLLACLDATVFKDAGISVTESLLYVKHWMANCPVSHRKYDSKMAEENNKIIIIMTSQ
jgi:hypothetical protein